MLRRIVLGIIAGLLIIAAGIAGTLAAWGQATFGQGQPLRLEAGTITPGDGAAATIIDVDRFDAGIPYLEVLGDFQLSAETSERGDPTDTLFLGAGSTPDVDAYLKGTPYTVAFREDAGWQVREVPGVRPPAQPRDQGFWLAESVGRPASIPVPASRPLTLVIMQPAGLATGPLRLTIDFIVADATTWILGLTITAGVLLILGLVVLVLALRSRRRVGRHEGEAVAAAIATVQPEPVEPVMEAGPADATEPVMEAGPAEAVESESESESEPVSEAGPADATEPVTEAGPADATERVMEAGPADATEPVSEAEPVEPASPPAEPERGAGVDP